MAEEKDIRPEEVDSAYVELVQVFQKHKLTVKEILLVYGNLGYTLGASIEGYEEGKGPNEQQLYSMYYTKATPGVALMCQGINITTWLDDINNIEIGGSYEKSKT